TGLTVLAADLSNASVFLGTGYGTPDAAGVGHSVPDVNVALVADPTGGRAWVAAKASDPGVVSVDVNSVAGDGTAIDFTHLDLNGDSIFGTELSGFADTGAQISATFANPAFDVAGLASGSATSVTVTGAILDATAVSAPHA